MIRETANVVLYGDSCSIELGQRDITLFWVTVLYTCLI
jgi:hypothetical protein